MKAYYGSRISENMTRTPEGYLICMNVPIARTGTQEYLCSELGICDDAPNGIIDVMREESEVFSPATIASFEGKPVTDEHPPDSLSLETIGAYSCGHAQNVRRGTGAESDCLVADLFITDPKLIDAIVRGRREVSCGYDCQYQESDGQLYQRSIRGNHVAVVPAGRAGSRVAIKDSAAKRNAEERGKTNMAKVNKNHSLFAKLFSRAVKDMEPDEVADAIEELAATEEDEDIETAAPMANPAKGCNDEEEPTIAQLKDAIDALTEKVNALTAQKDEDPEKVLPPADEEPDPLQKLEDELNEEVKKESNPSDEEAAITVPADELPEDIEDEDGPEAEQRTLPNNPIPGADKAIAVGVISAIRPVIASLPREQRKRASDAAVKQIRKLIGKDAKPKTNSINTINAILSQAAKAKAKDAKAYVDNGDLGKQIMLSRNPHYKK